MMNYKKMKICLLLVIIFFETMFSLKAQWQLLNGPGTTSIYAIGNDDNNWYAILGSGLFRSQNEGKVWEYFNTMGYLANQTANCILNDGDTIYIGSNKGVYYSTDSGNSWELINKGITKNKFQIGLDSNIIALGSSTHNIYASTGGKLYTIDKIKKEFSPVEIDTFMSYKTMYVTDKYLLLGSWHHSSLPSRIANIIISKDEGKSWNYIIDSLSGIYEQDINCFALSNDTIYAGTSNGIYASYDEGNNWELLQNGLLGYEITNILITENGTFAGTKSGMFYTSEIGEFWEKRELGLTNKYILSMSKINGKILVGTAHGLFLTSDNGINWVSINNGLGGGSVEDINESSGTIYANPYGEGLFSSPDLGQSWSLIVDLSSQIFDGPIAVDNNNIYLASNRKWAFFYSLDNGVKWNIVSDSLAISGRKIFRFYIYNHDIIACTDKGILISPDSAKSWSSLIISPMFRSIYFDDSYIYAGSIGQGLFKSTNKGTEWIHDSTIFGANNILTDIVKSGTDIFVASYDGGVFKSTDNGLTWDSVNNGLSNKYIISLAEYNNNIFASTQNGIFLSTNFGIEWKEVSDGLTTKWIYKLLIVGANIFAGSPEGIFKAKLSDFDIVDVKESITSKPNYLYCFPPYPNPSTNTVRSLIYWDTSIDIENDDIAVYDIYGNKVAGKENIIIDKQNDYSGILSWNCTNVPDGIYLIRIIHGTKTWTMKVIVSK